MTRYDVCCSVTIGRTVVRVLISHDEAAIAELQARDPSAVALDLDQPFDRVVELLMPSRDVPGPGFVAQLRRNAAERQRFLDHHGALSAEEVADFAESSARNRRQTAHRWHNEDRSIFAVEHHGRTLYPGFQFDAGTRKPLPAVGEALSRLPRGLTGWALALWWDTPLEVDDEWVTPVEVIGDPARVSRLAQVEADRWRHDGAA
jgi:hypothetical protein